jgi:hypothetical protein
MVLTEGDVLAEEIGNAGLGVTVPAGDDRALEDALERTLASPPPPERFAAVAQRHTWDHAAQPLLEFCTSLTRAPDLSVGRLSPEAAAG